MAFSSKKTAKSLAQKTLSKHPYLPKIIKADPKDPKRFICLICSKNHSDKHKKNGKPTTGQFKWLRKHITTATHKSFTIPEEMKLLSQASKSLSRKAKISKSRFHTVNENGDSDDENDNEEDGDGDD